MLVYNICGSTVFSLKVFAHMEINIVLFFWGFGWSILNHQSILKMQDFETRNSWHQGAVIFKEVTVFSWMTVLSLQCCSGRLVGDRAPLLAGEVLMLILMDWAVKILFSHICSNEIIQLLWFPEDHVDSSVTPSISITADVFWARIRAVGHALLTDLCTVYLRGWRLRRL